MSRRAWLAAASALPLAGCGWLFRPGARTGPARGASQAAPSDERRGRIAWRYIENNTDYDTGLVNGMDRAPVFTAWNLADAIAAVVAGHELNLIETREFDLRLSRLLGFAATMDLSGGQMPHKAYHAATGKMVAFDGRPDDIGWSAIDSGRLLLWLRIVAQRHPRFAEHADKAVLRWSFCDAIDDCGTLYGTARTGGQVQRYQEGRLGYEQLAAAGYAAWGFETRHSASWANTQAVNIYGIPVAHDARDPRTTGAQAPVLTMPHALMGLELGWRDARARALADAVYRVQQERWRREGQLTARTDYQSRQPPYVVLDSVFAAGYPWNTIGADGKEYEQLALVSTRAAFAMAALWPGEYAQRLMEGVQWLHDPDRGWYEGRYEQGGAPLANITLSTNAAILETLLFKAKGPLYAGQPRTGLFELRTGDVFQRTKRCSPAERAACAAEAAR
nr:DUF3131 domain-containing protein [Ramlibacter alkalitolerans]